MLFTAVIHKLKLHQINLASFRCESASNRATSVATANALATGVTRYLERLIGVGLYFKLGEESLTLDLHPGNVRIRLNISSEVFFMNTPCTLLKLLVANLKGDGFIFDAPDKTITLLTHKK